MANFQGFVPLVLGGDSTVFIGELPARLTPDAEAFEALWNLHPELPPTITIHGRTVPLPRWQQAYGRDYRFSGAVNQALPTMPALQPFLDWARMAIDGRLNGLLLNWYDGAEGHYIGKHWDSIIGIVPDTPFVTISPGEARPFRFQRWKSSERRDVVAPDGSVIVIPFAVNRTWTHAVPKTAKAEGKRISITLRAFEGEDRGAG